jgi:hypothetical protein
VKCRKYLVTWAQNATPVHRGFWAAAQSFCQAEGAELIVIPGRYKNPTSVFSDKQAAQDWWAEETLPYLAARFKRTKTPDGSPATETIPVRRKLCKGLTVYADISIQPTKQRPLTGFEGFMGASSGIFGHAKRAMEVVPTSTRTPRLTYTTSACTVANYTDSAAGKKGLHHHVIGGLVVEVDQDGLFWCRHVSANHAGAFTDLDNVYSPSGVKQAPRALSLVLGDIHSGREDEEVLEATQALCELLKPRTGVLHDVLDFEARNHHGAQSYTYQYDHRFDTVESEMIAAAGTLRRFCGWEGVDEWAVVRSNHDEAFDKWVGGDVPDSANETYWCEVRARRSRARDASGGWPDCFALEARRLGVPDKVRFLRRNDSLMIADVEHAHHGHIGLSGARGSRQTFLKLGCKMTTGHTHVPCTADGLYTAGVTAHREHGYNDLPCAWVHAHVVLYADGKRAIVVIQNGKYRGGMR